MSLPSTILFQSPLVTHWKSICTFLLTIQQDSPWNIRSGSISFGLDNLAGNGSLFRKEPSQKISQKVDNGTTGLLLWLFSFSNYCDERKQRNLASCFQVVSSHMLLKDVLLNLGLRLPQLSILGDCDHIFINEVSKFQLKLMVDRILRFGTIPMMVPSALNVHGIS